MSAGMKIVVGLVLFLLVGATPESKETVGDEKELLQLTQNDFQKIPASRPRLFCRDFSLLKQNYRLPEGRRFGERIIHDAGRILSYPVCERELEGRRLLSVSRNVLYRVNTLLTAWVLTGNAQYAERARSEILAAGDFSDWNPSHFLDVGEMTLAVATGYDWLYDRLSPVEREKIRTVIIEKGLKPSLDERRNWWIGGASNWTQVCHAGMLAGALAVHEDEPELAFRIIDRAIRNMPKVMKASYGIDGTYPEGVMYWSYGTEFNSVLLLLLETVFGHTFGLAELPGLQKSGDFVRHCAAPTGIVYSYGDSRPVKIGINFATAYLVKKFGRPDFLDRHMRESFDRFCRERPKNVRQGGNRLMPLTLFLLDGFAGEETGAPASPLYYRSDNRSIMPIAAVRSGWEDDAVYLAMKGGVVNASHGHMDVGSFVIEMNGMRVAEDLGMENYHKIEQLGLSLWNMKADSDRWKIFRIGPASHNIAVIDGKMQELAGKALLAGFDPQAAEPAMTWDLSASYRGQAESFLRTGKLLAGRRGVTLTDEFAGLKAGSGVRWQMCTALNVKSVRDNEAVLSGKGGEVVLRGTPGAGCWRVAEASTLLQSFDSAADKFRMLYFECTVPASGRLEYTITFESR